MSSRAARSRSRSRSRSPHDRDYHRSSNKGRNTRSSRSRSPAAAASSSHRRRSRSRSYERRDRERQRDRERERERERDRDRERSRERDRASREDARSRADRQAVPFGERSAQSIEERLKKDAANAPQGPAPVILTDDMDEGAMMAALGLPCGFDTTQGKEVKDGNVAGVRVQSKRQYRQYMNRKGGFNRPLAPSY